MLSKIKGLKNIKLTRNAPQKFFSVLAAIFLWLLIMEYENPEMTKTFRDIPVTYSAVEQLVADKLYVETPLDQMVDITVRGRRKDVLSLEDSDLIATVDMSKLTSGTIDLAIALSCKSERITIINANKMSLRVVIDDIVTVHKTIKHFTEGELPTQYEVIEKKISPSIVSITGPQKKIDTIDRIILPYSLADLSSSVTFYDEVVIIDKNGKIIEDLTLSDDRFKVELTIGRVVDLPITYNYKALETENLVVVSKRESTQTVKVKGSIENLKSLKKIESQQIVIPEAAGQHELSVVLELPEGIKKIAPLDISASVDCDFIEQNSYTLTDKSINPLNLDARYIYQLTDNFSKNLQLTGYRSIFQAEDYSEPSVTIDFNNLTAGNYTLPYRVVIADGLSPADSNALTGEVEVVISERDEE